ncbi:MAG: ribbon-helix-helix domain-containing protein [Gammaproteobacteria bacterium]|nr:ribbon-helix-helix domain-containing protein [Gammaproteobacteria bacterium]
MTRWTVVIPDETNQMLRSHLALRGAKKGELSKFVDKAVKQTIFRETVQGIKDDNEGFDQSVIEETIAEAVDWARENRS